MYEEETIMTAFQEFITAFALFTVAFIVIPVSVFAIDIIKNYIEGGKQK